MSGMGTGSSGSDTLPPDGRFRVLVVDDEEGITKALARALRKETIEVVTASSGAEGFERLSEAPVHLVISDYMMPKMNGAEFLRRVKECYPDTVRIMLTGHADTGAVMGAISEGAVYKFVLKPWNDDDLRLTVALALKQHELERHNLELNRDNERKAREISSLADMASRRRTESADANPAPRRDLLLAQPIVSGSAGIDTPMAALGSLTHGLTLACGPVGDGRTATLHPLLRQLADQDRECTTIGTSAREASGKVAVQPLRTALRHASDVILLEEIFDDETAALAVDAALAGHTVFSALHATSALGALTRLLHLGVKADAMAAVLDGVVARRLLRRVCPECIREESVDPTVVQRQGVAFGKVGSRVFRGAGCPACGGTGYSGYVAAHEVLMLDDEVRDRLSAGAGMVEIGRVARRRGFGTLLDDAIAKVRAGDTTLDEALRVFCSHPLQE
jgi:CheY-like chemotaxis protein